MKTQKAIQKIRTEKQVSYKEASGLQQSSSQVQP